VQPSSPLIFAQCLDTDGLVCFVAALSFSLLVQSGSLTIYLSKSKKKTNTTKNCLFFFSRNKKWPTTGTTGRRFSKKYFRHVQEFSTGEKQTNKQVRRKKTTQTYQEASRRIFFHETEEKTCKLTLFGQNNFKRKVSRRPKMLMAFPMCKLFLKFFILLIL
jgi:hypothetical protein